MGIKSFTITVSVLSVVSTTVLAAPLNYNEAIDGDLNNQILMLDTGVNTISGEWTVIQGMPLDRDRFSFTIPENMQLTGVSYSFDDSGVSVPTGWALSSQYLIASLASDRGNVLIPGTPSPQNFFSTLLPLQEGTYTMGQNTAFQYIEGNEQISIGDGGTVPYTWSMSVESTVVPVPAALWLFASGLFGLLALCGRSINV